MTSTSGRGGTLFVLIAACLWGTTGAAAAQAPEVSALTIGAAAMGVGGLLQACVAIPSIRSHRRLIARSWRMVVLSAAAAAIYPLAFYSSMRMSGVAIGTVITIGTAPIFAAAVEYAANGCAPTRRWSLAAVAGVGGVALLAFSPGQVHAPTSDLGSRTLGIALALAAGATYATYTWGAKRMVERTIPSHAAMGAIFGAAGVPLLALTLLTSAQIAATPASFWSVAYLAVIPMFLGYLAFGQGLRTVSASRATTLTLTEPVVAALIAVGLLGEQLPVTGWLGIALVLAGLPFMATYPPKTGLSRYTAKDNARGLPDVLDERTPVGEPTWRTM